MMDDRLDEQLQDLAAEYNRPPETPREEMWTAIQRNRAAGRMRKPFRWKPLVWSGLAAAALAVGSVSPGRSRAYIPSVGMVPGAMALSRMP